jgi:hypothetical protein
VHDLTGLHSVYTHWRSIEVMFHVATLLPYEKNDPQKLQRKRHVGNDIVCVVFLEADNTRQDVQGFRYTETFRDRNGYFLAMILSGWEKIPPIFR